MITNWIFSECYIFAKTAKKAKTRLDCIACTGGYAGFEVLRATKQQRETAFRDALDIGDLICYLNKRPEHFRDTIGTPSIVMTKKGGNNLSTIYVPYLQKGVGFGDFVNTNDAIIFILRDITMSTGKIGPNAMVEVYIAKNMGVYARDLCSRVMQGIYNTELITLKQKAMNKGANGILKANV